MNKLAVGRAIVELNNVVSEIDEEMCAGIIDEVPHFSSRLNHLKQLRATVRDTIANLKREL